MSTRISPHRKRKPVRPPRSTACSRRPLCRAAARAGQPELQLVHCQRPIGLRGQYRYTPGWKGRPVRAHRHQPGQRLHGNGQHKRTEIPRRYSSLRPTSPTACARKGEINLERVSGGTPPFTYSRDGGQTFQASPVFSNLSPDDYSLVARDAHGCTAVGMVTWTSRFSRK